MQRTAKLSIQHTIPRPHRATTLIRLVSVIAAASAMFLSTGESSFGRLLVYSNASAAKPERSERLLRLLRRRPRGMSVDVWRNQRREAARELGRRKERRAVSTLIDIVDKERFDVILEIAIEALGNIGDKRAVPSLRHLLADPSLDGYARDAVANSLRLLGASDETAGSGHSTTPPDDGKTDATTGGGSNNGSTRNKPDLATRLNAEQDPDGDFRKLPAHPLVAAATLSSDDEETLARSERFGIVAGAANATWDSGSGSTSASLNLGSRYRTQRERRSLGYSISASGDLTFAIQDPVDDNNTTWGLNHGAKIDSEVRYYPFLKDLPPLFGQLIGGFDYGVALQSPATALEKRFGFASTLLFGGGPGYGRILDVGSRLRLERFERVLRRAGYIEKEITGQAARDLMVLWYSLRDTIGRFAHLGYSLRLLRKAELLTGTIDPATAYRLIRILDDPQLSGRNDGMMFRAGYGFAHEFVKDVDDRNHGFVYATADLAFQRGTIREIGGTMRFFFDHMSEPKSFTLSMDGYFNWFLYNRAFDPLGALGATVGVGVSKQPGSAYVDSGLSYSALAGIAYTRFFDRGSRLIASAKGGMQSHGALVLFTLEAQYGIADGSFVTNR